MHNVEDEMNLTVMFPSLQLPFNTLFLCLKTRRTKHSPLTLSKNIRKCLTLSKVQTDSACQHKGKRIYYNVWASGHMFLSMLNVEKIFQDWRSETISTHDHESIPYNPLTKRKGKKSSIYFCRWDSFF